MANMDIEKALKEYYTAEAIQFTLPQGDFLHNLKADTAIASPRKRRALNIKIAAAMAACVVLIFSIVAVAYKLGGGSETSLPISNEIICFDGLQDWYSPGELVTQSLYLSGNIDMTVSQRSGSVRLLSAGEKASYSFPEWVYSARQINDRYILLTCAWPEYKHIIAEMGHDIVYDIRNGEIFSLGNRIIELDNENVLGENITCFDITLQEFGASTEWCAVEADSKQYMANIETGDIRELPNGNIFKVSSDYKHIAMWQYTDKDGYRIFVLNTETMSTTEITSDTDKYATGKNGVFSPDGKYYLQAYYFNSGTEYRNETTTRWKIINLETGENVFTKGMFKKFTSRGDTVILQTAKNDITGYTKSVAIRLSDGADVTETYEFARQDLFEIAREGHGSVYSLYVLPLFEGGEKTLLAENVRDYQEWGGYYYIYVNGSNKIAVYSPEDNSMFTQKIENFDSVNLNREYVSVSVLDEGKKCIVVSYKRNEDVGFGGDSEVSHQQEVSDSDVSHIPETSTQEESYTENIIPEINGEVEFLDIPFEMNIITVPLLDPIYAIGQYPWNGGIRLSPEELPIGETVAEYWKPDEGDPSYNEWITKYTDEWFEDNWLIIFQGVEKEFNVKHLGFHFIEGQQTTMIFIYDEGDPDFKWDMTYGTKAFIEIAKKDIPYDLSETYIVIDENGSEYVRKKFFFKALEREMAKSNGYKLPE